MPTKPPNRPTEGREDRIRMRAKDTPFNRQPLKIKRPKASKTTKPTSTPASQSASAPRYEPPKPKILVRMSATTTDNQALAIDPTTAQTLLISVRRSLKQLEGGVEWRGDKQRLAAVEAALVMKGVRP